MKLVFTDEAKADLLQIGEWIAEDNPPRALTFVDELETRCARLTAMPRAYPLVPRHENSRIAACGACLTAITSSSIASLLMRSKFFTSCTAHAITNRSCFLTLRRSEFY
jgi:plasmid stabilization system protein ParE